MTRRLLVPVDLATEDPPELKFAADLAKATSAEIVVLHVIDYVPTLLPVELPGGYPLPQLDVIENAVGQKMGRMIEKAGLTGVKTLVEVGGAATAIVDVAKREKVDQIIIGSHSHKAIARLVLGSVADRVAHTATCPVTIVRVPAH
jgi:nucleotide-binding universal stress UspA family protein